MNTIVGVYQVQKEIWLEDIVLPEFDRNQHIQAQKAYVFDQPCRYDLIMGRDFLTLAGISLNFEQLTMMWMNLELRMRRNDHEAARSFNLFEALFTADLTELELDDQLES